MYDKALDERTVRGRPLSAWFEAMKLESWVPARAFLVDAARRLLRGTPAVIERTARWLELDDGMRREPWSAPERVGALANATFGPYVASIRPGPVIWTRVLQHVSAEAARAVREAGLAEPSRGADAAFGATHRLILEGDPIDPRLDALRWILPPTMARDILWRIPEERRDVVLRRLLTANTGSGAEMALEMAVYLRPLLDKGNYQAELDAMVAMAREYSASLPVLRVIREGGLPRTDAEDVTELIRPELEYVLDKVEADARAKGVGFVAEAAAETRIMVSDAAELTSVEAWARATDARRRAIAKRVAKATKLELLGLEDFGGPPIAVYADGERRLHLVPGGTFQRGFSEAEEAKVREAAERRGIVDQYEEYGFLIDQLPTMRPVRAVWVGPFLVGRDPGEVLEPSEVADWLKEGPFRLPTEAEWEYAARGGVAGQLTYRGDALPDEAWFQETDALGPEACNAFGLWGFGLEPEMCADAWASGYEDAPADGSARAGAGPRVVRGGAAEVYPWQACGEWQLLLTAVRGDQKAWEYGVAVRPVLGLKV